MTQDNNQASVYAAVQKIANAAAKRERIQRHRADDRFVCMSLALQKRLKTFAREREITAYSALQMAVEDYLARNEERE